MLFLVMFDRCRSFSYIRYCIMKWILFVLFFVGNELCCGKDIEQLPKRIRKLSRGAGEQKSKHWGDQRATLLYSSLVWLLTAALSTNKTRWSYYYCPSNRCLSWSSWKNVVRGTQRTIWRHILKYTCSPSIGHLLAWKLLQAVQYLSKS